MAIRFWQMVGLTCLVSSGASGDSIRIDGKLHDNVYVSTSGSFYYVIDPSSGTVLNVARDRVAPEDVQLTDDPEARRAMLQAWRERGKGKSDGSGVTVGPAEAAEAPPSADADAKADSTGVVPSDCDRVLRTGVPRGLGRVRGGVGAMARAFAGGAAGHLRRSCDSARREPGRAGPGSGCGPSGPGRGGPAPRRTRQPSRDPCRGHPRVSGL